MSGIHSNLKEIMEARDPNLSIRQLAKDINYHFDSVRKMYKDEMIQYPRDLLLKLCKYFKVGPGQLIVIEADELQELHSSEKSAQDLENKLLLGG